MHEGYNWQNEDGEPFVTAAELRFEAELDALSAQEQADEAWLDSWDEDEWDEDDEDTDGDDWHVAEDSHLDGMWEE